jgi:hypothetical protein
MGGTNLPNATPKRPSFKHWSTVCTRLSWGYSAFLRLACPILRRGRYAAVRGRYKSPVHDQHGAWPVSPLDRRQGWQRREMIHHSPRSRPRNPEQRRKLPIGHIRAGVDRPRQHPISQRQPPPPPSPGSFTTTSRHYVHQIVEPAHRQTREHRHPLRVLPADRLHQRMIVRWSAPAESTRHYGTSFSLAAGW